jgi:hypothetical protein
MVAAVFEALWKSVLDHWQDERAHSAFLEYCQSSEKLAEAAARYRGMKGDRERSAVAEKRLAGIAIVALAQLHASRSKAAPVRGIGSLILAGCFGLGAVGLLAYLLSTR